MRKALPGCVALLLSGCGGDDRDRPVPVVRGEVDLVRGEAGPPDAGTRAGHGGEVRVGFTGSATFAFTGRVRPADSRVAVASQSGSRGAVVVEPSGRFSAAVTGLRRGPNELSVRATRAGHRSWSLGVRVVRARPRAVRVPARDGTPPIATLRFEPPGAAPVLRVSPSAAGDRTPLVRLAEPAFRAVAIARDDDGGTGRVRLSTTYVRDCGGGLEQEAVHLPPAQIQNVALVPGTRAPAERARRATIRLRAGRGCSVAGEASVEATNGRGLQAVSRHVRFAYSPRGS